jgi:hypothetical protein
VNEPTRINRFGLGPQQRTFVAGYDGDYEATAKRCCIEPETAKKWTKQAWFWEALKDRCDREAALVAKRTADRMAAAVASRAEVQAFWTMVMRGEEVPILDPDTGMPLLDEKGCPMYSAPPSTKDRIAAARCLADSLGMQNGVTTLVVEGGVQPIVVRHEDIADRARHLPRLAVTADWLS